MTKQCLEQKYNVIIKQMDYNSIMHAIPKLWLKKIRNKDTACNCKIEDDVIYLNIDGKRKKIQEVFCKDIYWLHVKSFMESPVAEEKWKKYLNVNDLIWKDHYLIPYIVCRDTSLQSFQYKIFNRFYPCNYTLSIWYKDQDPLCRQCKLGIDYIEHYFYFCSYTRLFWEGLQKWWQNTIGSSIVLDVHGVLFGVSNQNNDKFLHFINFCILHGKWYIHECKTKDLEIFLFTFIRKLKEHLMLEKILCELNGETKFIERFSEYYKMM